MTVHCAHLPALTVPGSPLHLAGVVHDASDASLMPALTTGSAGTMLGERHEESSRGGSQRQHSKQ